jgi:hypothetical protein
MSNITKFLVLTNYNNWSMVVKWKIAGVLFCYLDMVIKILKIVFDDSDDYYYCLLMDMMHFLMREVMLGIVKCLNMVGIVFGCQIMNR